MKITTKETEPSVKIELYDSGSDVIYITAQVNREKAAYDIARLQIRDGKMELALASELPEELFHIENGLNQIKVANCA